MRAASASMWLEIGTRRACACVMGFDGEGVSGVDRDRFLTHVMLYLLTATAGSAARE